MRLLNRLIGRTGKSTTRVRPASRLRRALTLAGGLAACTALLAGGGVWLVKSGMVASATSSVGANVAAGGRALGLAIGNVSVEGRERVSPAAILDALGARRGAAILAVDLDAARERLEALPWVRSAAIERRLPDTIHVHLTERQPLAFWQRHGQLSLLDTDGKVIPTDRLDRFSSLLVLVGDDVPQKAASLIAMLSTEPDLSKHVTAAVRVGGRRWNLRFDSGIDVELPEDNQAGAWHRLAALDRSDQLMQRNIQAVDLRLPDRLVVRLPPEPPKASPHKKSRPIGKPT